MKFSFLPSAGLRLAVLALILSTSVDAFAQAQGARGGNAGARGGAPNAGRGGVTLQGGGGGVGGGGTAGAVRQYPNSTMVGEALVTSDLETRRLIIVTDDVTNENIRTIVASLDKPKPQVLINVVFVQVTHDKGLDLGAEGIFNGNLSVASGNPPTSASTKFGLAAAAADPTFYGAFYRILGQDLNVTLHALAAVTKTEILSRPSILTRNNQQATIMVGQSVPFITNSRVVDASNTTINTVQYQDIGIILRVTPFITEEGLVEMIVSPEISSLSATTVPISNTVNAPVIDKRSADTVVVTRSDQTVVIGGLISTQAQERESKVPLLGDIPLLGNAFKRKHTNNVKTELLIFLTPHVVQNPGDLSRTAASEFEQLELAPKVFPRTELDRYIGKP